MKNTPCHVRRLSDLPDLTDDLVDNLDHLYPERCPDIMDTERTIWMYAGARELVRKLNTVRIQQRTTAREHVDHLSPE